MAVSTKRANQRITLLMLVLVSVTLLTLDYHGEANRAIGHVRNGFQDAVSPIQRAVADILHPIGDVFAGAFRYGSLQSQNTQLQHELGTVDRSLAEEHFAESQIAQVGALDHIRFAGDLKGVDAAVISAPTSNFAYTIEIGQGTSSGIGPGMPVLGANGFVGTVLSASSSTAVVRLAADVHSHVGVRFGTSSNPSALAVLSGDGPGKSLSSTTALPGPRVGSIAYTSGLAGELYPPGLPVGVVASVRVAAGGLEDNVTVKPLVDVGSLEFVRVVIWNPPA